MISVKREVGRLSHTLVWRGALMLLLALGAVARPEEALVPALLFVGGIAALAGVYEMSIAVSIRSRAPHWRLVLADGAASLGFGMLTVGATGVDLRAALAAIAAWLVLYAAIAARAARLVGAGPARWMLILWAGLDVGLAVLVVAYREATVFALLFLGAAYAAAFGAWQLGLGIWLRSELRRRSRTVSAEARPHQIGGG